MHESGRLLRDATVRGPSAHADGCTSRGSRAPVPATDRVRFEPRVVLTKEEAFTACQVLADAGRALVRSGGADEADTLCSLFALLEERLVVARRH